MTKAHTCPKCSRPLSHAFVREDPDAKAQQMHVLGGSFVECTNTGKVIGDCPRCGIVSKTLYALRVEPVDSEAC